jgi:RNA polymerase sigma-70 factor (ECF subfamily)
MLARADSGPPADLCFALASSCATKLQMKPTARQDAAAAGRNELSALLERVGAGDHRAFSALYDRTAAKLYGICLRLLGSEAEAQDVMQEAYVTVWRKADRYDPSKASPITWLAVLARNKAIDRLRRSSISTEDLSAAADVEDESPSAFKIVARADDELRLRKCMEELDSRAGSLIRAAFLDGASYPELAERDNVPLGTMKSWIRRGLRQLRGCLER